MLFTIWFVFGVADTGCYFLCVVPLSGALVQHAWWWQNLWVLACSQRILFFLHLWSLVWLDTKFWVESSFFKHVEYWPPLFLFVGFLLRNQLGVWWAPFVDNPNSFSILFCSLAGEELWSQEERHSGFWWFHAFCAAFFPSSWIYLRLDFEVGDFWIGSLSGRPFCWCWSYTFLFFFSFPLTVMPLCCRIAGGPLQTLLAWESSMGAAEQQGLLPVLSSGSFVLEGYPPDIIQSSPVWSVS